MPAWHDIVETMVSSKKLYNCFISPKSCYGPNVVSRQNFREKNLILYFVLGVGGWKTRLDIARV